MIPLPEVIAVVEAEGARLREEFHRADGPRGSRGSAPIDTEIEQRLRERLQRLVAGAFLGEETGFTPGTLAGWTWLVDPQDGTSDFLKGRRGSAVSVALLRERVPVLGVVHSPCPPDRGPDTIAWAEGAGPIVRNGRPLATDLSRKRLAAGELLFATDSSNARPETFGRAAAPGRFVAMPSIAYRLARVAAGDGVATLSAHPVNEYDIAAGMALVRAAKGILLDAEGREIALSGVPDSRVTGLRAGAPEAARRLVEFDWNALQSEAKREPRLVLGYPRREAEALFARARGHFVGLLAGQGGALEAAKELALACARSIVAQRGYSAAAALVAYLDWERATPGSALGAVNPRSRAVPIGLWAMGDPVRAAAAAREDAVLTHPDPAVAEACASRAAAIAQGAAAPAVEAGEILRVMSSRPSERPSAYWPDDAIDLAEALALLSCGAFPSQAA